MHLALRSHLAPPRLPGDALLRLGHCASQTKPICPDPAPLPSAKSFWLYFAGIMSRDPSKEAQPVGRILPVPLTVDAMMLLICPFVPPDHAFPGLHVSVVVFVAVELAFVLFFFSVMNLDSCLSLHELVNSDSLSLPFGKLTFRTAVHLSIWQWSAYVHLSPTTSEAASSSTPVVTTTSTYPPWAREQKTVSTATYPTTSTF